MDPCLSAERTARAALAANRATGALSTATFEKVGGGLSNHAWRVEQGGRAYFVRLGGPESASLGVDREAERALLGTASAAGLAPEVVACDPASGLLVSRYVHGAPWTRQDAHEPRNVARLAGHLRVLHSLPVPSGVSFVDFAAQARRLETLLERAPASEHAAVIRSVTGRAFAALASRRQCPVPCHNDLHHLNLLDDGDRLWLVDWEYGGLGDPAFDLASFACQHEFTAAGRELLLEAYGTPPIEGRRSPMIVDAPVLDAACVAFDYVQWLWYRYWALRHADADGEYAFRAGALGRKLAALAP